MPISGNIYSNMQAPDILGGVERGLKMSDMLQEKQKLRAEQERQTKINETLQKGMTIDQSGNVSFSPETLSSLSGVAKPQEIMQFGQQMQQQRQAKLEQNQKILQQGAQVLSAVKGKPDLYPAAREQILKLGVNPNDLPAVYDEQQIDFLVNKAMTLNDQIAQMNKQKELGFKEQEIELKKKEYAQKQAEAAGKTKEIKSNQAIAAGFGRRMEQAEGIFADVKKAGFDRSTTGSGIGSMMPNVWRQKEAVQNDQAERNFINATLRRESGAAISPEEFKSAELQYFPRAGDDPQTLENKRANRQQQIEMMKAEAGDAWNKIQLVKPKKVGEAPTQTEAEILKQYPYLKK